MELSILGLNVWKSRSERSFSMELAVEILRRMLEKVCDYDRICFLQSDVRGTAVQTSGKTMSKSEEQLRYGKSQERYIEIKALFPTHRRAFPEAPAEDRRKEIQRVEATVRLFSVEGGVTHWRPHFVKLAITDENGSAVGGPFEFFFEDGQIANIAFIKLHKKNADNPCEEMCVNQVVANYPGAHPRIHGRRS